MAAAGSRWHLLAGERRLGGVGCEGCRCKRQAAKITESIGCARITFAREKRFRQCKSAVKRGRVFVTTLRLRNNEIDRFVVKHVHVHSHIFSRELGARG